MYGHTREQVGAAVLDASDIDTDAPPRDLRHSAPTVWQNISPINSPKPDEPATKLVFRLSVQHLGISHYRQEYAALSRARVRVLS